MATVTLPEPVIIQPEAITDPEVSSESPNAPNAMVELSGGEEIAPLDGTQPPWENTAVMETAGSPLGTTAVNDGDKEDGNGNGGEDGNAGDIGDGKEDGNEEEDDEVCLLDR